MNKDILDSLDIAITICDKKTREIYYCNPAAIKFYKYGDGDYLGKKCYEIHGYKTPCPYCNVDSLEKHPFYILEHEKNKRLPDFITQNIEIIYEEKECQMEFAVPSEKEKGVVEQILRRMESSNIIISSMQSLSTNSEFGESVNEMLDSIVRYYHGDRCYIFRFDWVHDTSSNVFECCMEGITPEIHNLQNIPNKTIVDWVIKFGKGECIQINNVNSIPDSRKKEKDILLQQGINSVLVVPIINEIGELTGYLGVDNPRINVDDVEFLKTLTFFEVNEFEKRKLRQKLEEMSYTDSLTGLYNRNYYSEYIDNFPRREPQKVGVAFFDLNGLKKMNDSYGHDYGDAVISHVAEVLLENIKDAQIFRLSGDEFLVVEENIDYNIFSKKIEKVKKLFIEDGRSIISCGYTWNKLYTDVTKVITKADNLMYTEKQHYYATQKTSYSNKPKILNKLLDSLAKQDNYLAYIQPKQALKDSSLSGGEILVRYNDPKTGIVPPNRFLPLLEKEHLISHIDFFIFEETCHIVEKWKKKYKEKARELTISMNFSRVTLMDSQFLERVDEIMGRYSIDPPQIEIEVTETEDMWSKTMLSDVIKKLRNRGYKIALDDFGVDHSTMELLTFASFDTIKLDKKITDSIETERGNITIKALIDMAHTIGSECIAEGVETKETFNILRNMGCDYIQGYYFGRPMPIKEYEDKYLK